MGSYKRKLLALALVLLSLTACSFFGPGPVEPSRSGNNTLEAEVQKALERTLQARLAANATPSPQPPLATVTAMPTPIAWTTYYSPAYQIRLDLPTDWTRAVASGVEEKFSGPEGFVHISALNSAGKSLDAVAQTEAFQSPRAFGTKPGLQSILVQGQAARIILPSQDQAKGGPWLAELLVAYPQSVEVSGNRVDVLVVASPPGMIHALAASLQFEKQPVKLSGLKPPDSDTPAAGICGEATSEIAPITINLDTPSPRCMIVHKGQRLKVINAANVSVRVKLAQYDFQLAPGAERVLDQKVEDYLAPGVHVFYMSIYYGGAGASVWLK